MIQTIVDEGFLDDSVQSRLRVSTREKRSASSSVYEAALKKRKSEEDLLSSHGDHYESGSFSCATPHTYGASSSGRKRRFRAAVTGPPAGRVPHSNAVFPKKLREICETPECQKAIFWDDTLGGLVIRDPTLLRNEILPKFFRGKGGKNTDVYRSFRRQLVYYGFEEVTRRGGSSSPNFISALANTSSNIITSGTDKNIAAPRALDPETMQPVSVCVNKDPRIRRLIDLDSCRRYVTQYDPDKKRQLATTQVMLDDNDSSNSTIDETSPSTRPSSSSSLASVASFPFLSQFADDEYDDLQTGYKNTSPSDHATVAAILFSMRGKL